MLLGSDLNAFAKSKTIIANTLFIQKLGWQEKLVSEKEIKYMFACTNVQN